MGHGVNAKRAAPAEIKAIELGSDIVSESWTRTETEYSVYLMAKSKTGNDVKWRTKLYGRPYNTLLEKDVQNIHLKSLVLNKNILIAVDEKRQTYEVEFESGKLVEPDAPIDYPKAK